MIAPPAFGCLIIRTGLPVAGLIGLLLIPAFVILVLYGYLGWALVVFVTAGVTDGLDGVIARRTQRILYSPVRRHLGH